MGDDGGYDESGGTEQNKGLEGHRRECSKCLAKVKTLPEQ